MKALFSLPFFATIVLASQLAMAAPAIAEIEHLAFGEFTVTGTTVQSLVLAPSGSESNDAGLAILLAGHNATFRLTGFPANSMLAVMVDETTLDHQPSGPSFDITAFTFDPDPIHQTTDGAGNLILKVGATLSTRADTIYPDGPYRATYNMMVNY